MPGDTAVLPLDPDPHPRDRVLPLPTPRRAVQAAMRGLPGILTALAPGEPDAGDCPHARALEALGTLTSAASHELANLMTEIAMSAELMAERGARSPEDAEHLARIDLAVRRACTLSRELVRLARARVPEGGRPRG